MTSEQKTISMFKMTSYDPIQQVAGFTFIDDSNNVKNLLVSRMLFNELMVSAQWNQKKFGQMSSMQFSFKTCLKNNGKEISNWAKWFDEKSNYIVKDTASRSVKKND